MAIRYFRYFPEVKYGDYVLKDATKLGILSDTLENSGFVYMPYTVREEESAADIANFYYGDVSYVWLVYLSNKMKDPYHDWPMTQRQLEAYIEDQYLYACAVCTLKRTEQTIELFADILDRTAEMMLAIARKRTKSTFTYLDEKSPDFNQDYLDIWDWLSANDNADLTRSIPDEYGIENYIAIQETLQELLDNNFNPSYNGLRDNLYDLLLSIDSETGQYLYDLNGDGVLDEKDIADVKSYALGQYENIDPLTLSKFKVNINRIVDFWLAQDSGYYERSGEAPLFRLGRPMSFNYAYDYLMAVMPEKLADILVRIPNRDELKKTLDVVLWTQDSGITRNIIHYENAFDPDYKISADTYSLNLVGSSQTWTEFDPSEWNPIRIYDYEFIRNEEKRNIQLVAREYAKDLEGILEGIMK